MNEEWFILINGNREGPYSIEDLKLDSRLTPDTLVWKKKFKDWIAIRHVPELKEIFEDKPESKPLHDNLIKTPEVLPEQEALAVQNDPSQFFLWILVFILILVYLFYQLNRIS